MVQSVMKAVEVLFAVAEEGRGVSLTQVTQKVGLPVPTVKRFLDTLTAADLLRKEGKLYLPGLKAFELGKLAERHFDIVRLARPYLEELARATQESANLAVLDGPDVIYLSCAESPRMMRTFTTPGARVPAYATGVGKILLSSLDDTSIRTLYNGRKLEPFTARTITCVQDLLEELRKVRLEGIALDDGEREDGVTCLAGAIRDGSGKVVAAVSVSGPSTRLSGEKLCEVRQHLDICCSGISKTLGYQKQ